MLFLFNYVLSANSFNSKTMNLIENSISKNPTEFKAIIGSLVDVFNRIKLELKTEGYIEFEDNSNAKKAISNVLAAFDELVVESSLKKTNHKKLLDKLCEIKKALLTFECHKNLELFLERLDKISEKKNVL